MPACKSVVECIAHHAQNEPDALCLADKQKALTYQQMWDAVRGLAVHIRQEYGVGAYILLECTQDVDYMVWMLAMQLVGTIPVPLEKNASAARISEIAEETGATHYVARKIADGVEAALELVKIEQAVDFAKTGNDVFLPFPQSDDVAEILFSTGTTGKSKGIVLTHRNNMAIAQNVIEGVQMQPRNVEIIPMPLSHSHGLRRTYANLVNGSSVILVDGILALAHLFDLMDQYHATALDISPSVLSAIFKLSKDRIGDYAHVLDYVQLGSSPLDEESKARLMRLLPNTRLYNYYGSTEAGCSCIFEFSKYAHRQYCIGKPCVNAHFIVVDTQRNPIESSPQNTGLLASSGDINMKCYFNAPELTAKTMADGYVYTNDLGYIDDEGFVYMLGREDDVINYGGIKISPEEIEVSVSKHPIVHDCACIPIEDAISGQAPKLFIALKPGASYDEREFKTFLAQSLDASKLPKVIELIDEIPRTYNGKIKRKELIARS